MEKYLIQILETNNRVIVPEFGAFIIKQKKPLIILFNEFLQYNDGILVDTIARNEGIDTIAAKQQIDDFIARITGELDTKGSYSIPGIGLMTKNPSGKIAIENEEAKASKKALKTEGEEKPTPSKPRTAKKTVKKEETGVIPEKEETLEVELDSSENKIETISEIKKEPPVKVEEKPEAKQKTVTTPPVITQKKEHEPVHQKEVYKAKPLAYDESRRGKSRLMLWLLIIIIVNGLLIGYFIYSDKFTGLFTRQPAEEEVLAPIEDDQLKPEITPADIPGEAVPAKEQTIPVEEPEIQPPIPSTGSGFYIVAGVFREEANADKLVSELRRKGYNAEKFGKIGSLHAVSYNHFSTKAEADLALKKIQNELDPEAWIREVK